MIWTVIKLVSWTESYFQKKSIDSPRLTAEILLAYSLGIKRLDLYLQHDRPVQNNELSDFKALIKRRIEHEPVAYIIGEKGFFESDFKVTKDVLIPRPDTEIIVEQALKILEKENKKKIKFWSVLELGTGSGAIILSLAKKIQDPLYFASDISSSALKIAKENAQKISKDRINFFAGPWFSSLKRAPVFDLIVSNPPYISSHDILHLQPEIRVFEPVNALDGGKDGLNSLASILDDAGDYLVPGGTILLEIGFDQKKGVEDILMNSNKYQSIEFIKDLAGHDRVVKIKKSID